LDYHWRRRHASVVGMDITELGLARLDNYEPPARRPRLDPRELLLGIALAEERAYRENHPEREALTALRELVSDLVGLRPAAG
jgi:hypothetical protein